LRVSGWDLTTNVITFKVRASPCGFDRPVTQHFKDQVLSRLTRSGVGDLTVIIERDPRHELVLRFEGPREEVTKAQATFDEKEVPYSDGEGSAF